MSYANGVTKAPITIADVASAIGVSSGDLGTLCAHQNNNPFSLFKPIKHPNNDYVTLAQRIEMFHSLTPKDLPSLRSTSTFASVPTPESWAYVHPSGTLGVSPYRIFDYLHIETNLSQIDSANGYDNTAQSPMLMRDDVTVNISTDPTGGDFLCPTFKYDEHSVNGYGNANILLYLRDIIFRMYGNRDNVSAWKLPSSYDDIFNADGALTAGVWRFAIGLAIKTSASGPYKWVIISSPDPLSLPFSSANDPSVFLSHVIRPSYNQVVANIIKYAVRNYGQTQIDCIPFLACNLKYSSAQGWYFSGGSYERAITFPRGDTFRLTPSGFATSLQFAYVSFRIAWTNSNSVTQNIANLTWYTAQSQIISGQPMVLMYLPRPSGYSYCIMELTFKVSTHFGITSNMAAGLFVNSNSAGQLYTNDGSAIDNISGEWINTERTYKVRCMGPNLYTLMANTPESLFPLTDSSGFDMYFDNTQMASRQHKLQAGTGISLQTS